MKCPPSQLTLALSTLMLLLFACLLPVSVNRLAPVPGLLFRAHGTATPGHNNHPPMKHILQFYITGVTGSLSASTNTTVQQSAATSRTHPKGRKGMLAAKSAKSNKATRVTDKKVTAGSLLPAAPLVRDLYVAGHSRPHPELCPALGARLRLVILVSSAPAHAAAREAVRLTWGHAAQRADVALGFVLGIPPTRLRAALDREDALYGDLIQSRFIDSYSNLSLKTVSMLEWKDTYCPRAPRLLKTDDDMFINVNRLIRFAVAPERRNATNTVWGKLWRRSRPARASRSKYFVPRAQFPGSIYPTFAAGPAYLVTADAARRLLRAAPAARYLRLEDVFVTGVLAARLGVRRVHAPEFYNKKTTEHCSLRRMVAFHKISYFEQFDLWQKLHDSRVKCPKILRKRT